MTQAREDALRQQGLRPGEVVLCPDAPALDLVLMVLTLARMGAALCPYRAALDQAERAALADATGAEWFWCPASGMLTDSGRRTATPWPLDSPLSLLVKTSGSSGLPKVAMLTHANLQSAARAGNARLGLSPGDRWLCCLRLSHIGGLAIVSRCDLAGATLVLHAGFDAAAVARDLATHRITHVSLVPPMLDRLLAIGATPPPSLRVLLVGGQALSRVLLTRALAAGWPIHTTYGMTETAAQIATATHALARPVADGWVGPPLEGVQIRSDADQAQLRVRGPMVMAGYANPARRPGQGLRDGWLLTADRGRLDATGNLLVQGRADEILVIGGVNVSLRRIESVLWTAPGVEDLALVALPDPVWGHRLVVVYRGSLETTALARWCEAVLKGAERPRGFKRVSSLPLLDSGKHDRVRIRGLARSLDPDERLSLD
ncbi:MAG: AMP-dependent synthetase [Sphingobacteriia bacterium]|nr:AMP-dependent synthetase [Sphingobacteriia bacterium]NCC39034.1 AMP-dependent synthetase [Gammaproteobacteria bacterium]